MFFVVLLAMFFAGRIARQYPFWAVVIGYLAGMVAVQNALLSTKI